MTVLSECFTGQRLVKLIAEYVPKKFSVLIMIIFPANLRPCRHSGWTFFENYHSWPWTASILPPTIKPHWHFFFNYRPGVYSTVSALLLALHTSISSKVNSDVVTKQKRSKPFICLVFNELLAFCREKYATSEVQWLVHHWCWTFWSLYIVFIVFIQFITVTLPLSLSHTHTHTHSQRHTCKYTHTHTLHLFFGSSGSPRQGSGEMINEKRALTTIYRCHIHHKRHSNRLTGILR